ncbi:MAG TPA: Shedu immune nuclease family protein [Terracidiphilus sp.]|nr:Shedu immune nuclease family protein [Terracidiphilus sp.]
MKTLSLQRIARNLMKFTPPIILEETQTTRRCFYGELASDDDGEWDVRGTIVVERKGKDGWHQQDGASLQKLKGGEIAKLPLRREHLKHFITGLQVLADAAKLEGIDLRGANLVVGKREDVVNVGRERKALIEDLISSNHGNEFWDSLSSLRPDLASQLAEAELLKQRKLAVAKFERELTAQRWTEPSWEKFFMANEWIFGLGLRFQFLSVLQNQANYGGKGFARKGEQKGEFLMHTEAEDERFTVLVEIKRPDTQFFGERPYRSGVPGFTPEFMNAISQVQVNSHTWEFEGSKRQQDSERLAQDRIRTISPRSILVCGHTRELNNLDKRKAFELMRCNLRAPEILTFDELFARAKFIVRKPERPEQGIE